MDLPTTEKQCRVAFTSGHIDLPEAQFLEHYRKALDSAIDAKDQFIVSNAGGADSLALQYLLRQGVDPVQITIYIHTPPEHRQKNSNAKIGAIDELRTGDATLATYEKQGLNVRVIKGWHTQRDAAMSDYDILWVRSDEETKVLYGKKYRPGRISGTQKNKSRRDALAQEQRSASC
ncbi:hypothetical protein CERZMDRAFT_106862 [Cercospora zeae-maydis SCOH1-5]|uniref:Uncharacterized protein n=1 Tax=Cercospora zeae-maydis SCOH1-5 TaxID=717836 RepID=A0A6A6FA56_9PEZI|nr:hypothetical protein CERZMDRAFT_106862 [Cercospora zeae-maydis SCOH1-5]